MSAETLHHGPVPPGRLRIYLGYAPGAGTTCALLSEGHRRAERGTDVVVASARTHGRAYTAGLLASLEVISAVTIPHEGTAVAEMDLGTVLARRPAVALVDDLAHHNVPGARHARRWQDVEDLLLAGIDVISTASIQHLESLADLVDKITGAPPPETVPDPVIATADEVELVDVAPETLRDRRLAGMAGPAGRAADRRLHRRHPRRPAHQPHRGPVRLPRIDLGVLRRPVADHRADHGTGPARLERPGDSQSPAAGPPARGGRTQPERENTDATQHPPARPRAASSAMGPHADSRR
jgi:hypothetical protein